MKPFLSSAGLAWRLPDLWFARTLEGLVGWRALLGRLALLARIIRTVLVLFVPVFFSCNSLGGAQQAVANGILALDGAGGYVALPPDVFDEIEEATVEGWVRCDVIGKSTTRIFKYGEGRQELSLGVRHGRPWFLIASPGQEIAAEIQASRVIRSKKWHHLAGVSGPGGMRLYLDGFLVGTNQFTGSFNSIGSGKQHSIGQTAGPSNSLIQFQGQIDEVRVWNKARSAEEIQGGMSERLTGDEPGLAALWNFDGGDAHDSGPSQWHGELLDGARIIIGTFPGRMPEGLPSLIRGKLIAPAEENPRIPAMVRLFEGDTAVETTLTDLDGSFLFHVRVPVGEYRIWAALPGFETTLANIGLRPGEARDLELRIEPAIRSRMASSAYAEALIEALSSDPSLLQGTVDPSFFLELASSRTSALPVLVKMLESPDENDRRLAAFLLGRMSKSSFEAVQALQAAAQGEDRPTRSLAVLALRSLPPPENFEWLYLNRQVAGSLLIVGLLLPFALMHLIIFWFHPENRTNLYQGLFALAGAVLVYLLGQGNYGFSVVAVAALSFSLLGLLLLYSLFRSRVPWLFWGFGIAVAAVAASFLLHRDDLQQFLAFELPSDAPRPNRAMLAWMLVAGFLLFAAMMLEMLRLVISSIVHKRDGAEIMGAGFLILIMAGIATPVLWIRLFFGEMSANDFAVWSQILPHWGMAGFVACASIHLARNFSRSWNELARAGSDLEEKNHQLKSAQHEAANAREAAQAASESKSRFLAAMTHDLRAPLNAIIGHSEILQEIAEEDGQKEYVPEIQKIQAAAAQQMGLVNDMLDFSKIEAGNMTLFLEEFPVDRMVSEVAATIRPLVEKRGNCLELDCSPEAGLMRADQTKVRQVLFSLLSNASRFTEKGIVRLTVSRSGGDSPFIEFTVFHGGPGMSEEQIEDLFEAFSQAGPSIAKHFGGAGSTLAISKKLCQIMGGELIVESELGKGAAWVVTLPAELDQETLGEETPDTGFVSPPARAEMKQQSI